MEHKASYKVELLTLGYSSLAIDNRLRCITNFLNLLKKPAGLVKTKDIDYYIKYTIDKKLHSNSIHNYFTIIDQYFVFLEQRGVIKKNPFNAYSLQIKKDPKNIREILSQQEIKELYKLANTKEKIILHLCYACGLRAFEMEKITPKDINLIQKNIIVINGKNNKRRVIPLSNTTYQDLKQYLINTSCSNNKPFLSNSAGTPLKRYTALKMIQKLGKKARITKKITLHGLRHSIATHLIENGLSLEQVQLFLGHQQIETTTLYTRIKQQQLKQIISL